jgi:hypothetical protein
MTHTHPNKTMTTPEPIESPEIATNTPSVTGGCCGPSPCSQFSDTDRLNYLLQFIRIDDVGDEEYCKGIVVDHESLEEKVGLGPEGSDRIMRGTIRDWNDDLRDVIDRAMVAHNFANTQDRSRPPIR